MQYYNTASKEVKSHHQLCIDENASIAVGLIYGQWTPVQIDPVPPGEGKVFDYGPIELRGDEAFQTWVEVAPVEPPAP